MSITLNVNPSKGDQFWPSFATSRAIVTEGTPTPARLWGVMQRVALRQSTAVMGDDTWDHVDESKHNLSHNLGYIWPGGLWYRSRQCDHCVDRFSPHDRIAVAVPVPVTLRRAYAAANPVT